MTKNDGFGMGGRIVQYLDDSNSYDDDDDDDDDGDDDDK